MAERSYLAIGDSYTIGEGVADSRRWPVILSRQINDKGSVGTVSAPKIVAVTGWTTDELGGGMDKAHLADSYDLVSLLIGVNDQYRGRPVEAYGPAFDVLLERAVGLTQSKTANHVVVVSIPDWGVTPFGQRSGRSSATVAAEIDAYNATAKTITEQRGAHWVDITPLTRQQSSMVVSDGLHPNGGAYALWVDLILPAAIAALS
mmetsp:Transcript_720/g.2566  ORF Transcript_720/g.2566 Transcript_720/m.2566 type:complete len:204 (-) Transcript_720:46-657(-)